MGQGVVSLERLSIMAFSKKERSQLQHYVLEVGEGYSLEEE
jgi:hypothetical protein